MNRLASPRLDHHASRREDRNPIRFLLTFDDGPHANTPRVLNSLAENSIQPSIKALFFVQTRSPGGGGSWVGRFLMQREHREGHVLGLHTATPHGHISHTRMRPVELNQSLAQGIEDLATLTGRPVEFVRPPYWRFNEMTMRCYRTQGLSMVLSDLKAYDGINCGVHLIHRWNVRSQLRRIRARMAADRFPVVQGCAPLVAAFHDTNARTAAHLDEYLTVLLEEAVHAGFEVASRPFYDDAADLAETARHYASHRALQNGGQPR